MRFRIVVAVEVERAEGRFESRESLLAELVDALDGADPGTVVGPNDGTYEVVGWEVEEER